MKTSIPTYADLADFCEQNPQLKERFVAESVGIDPVRFSKLKNPGKYPVRPSDEEIEAIAKLLNRPARKVRALYEVAA